MESPAPSFQPSPQAPMAPAENNSQWDPEQLERLRQQAQQLKQAREVLLSQQVPQVAPPQIVYLRRNLTVAEILLILLLSCGIVTGVQWTWGFVSNVLPRIEIKAR